MWFWVFACIHYKVKNPNIGSEAKLLHALQKHYVHADFAGSCAIRKGDTFSFVQHFPGYAHQPQRYDYSLVEDLYVHMWALEELRDDRDKLISLFVPEYSLAEEMPLRRLLQYRSQNPNSISRVYFEEEFPFHSHQLRKTHVGKLLRMTIERAKGESFDELLSQQNWPQPIIKKPSASLSYYKEWLTKHDALPSKSFRVEDLCEVISAYEKGVFPLTHSPEHLQKLGFVQRDIFHTSIFHWRESKEQQRLSISWFPKEKICVSMVLNESNINIRTLEEEIWSHLFQQEHSSVSSAKTVEKIRPDTSWEGSYSGSMPLRLTVKIDNDTLYAAFDEHPFVPLQVIDSLEFSHDASGIRLQFLPNGNIPMLLLKTPDEEIPFWKISQ